MLYLRGKILLILETNDQINHPHLSVLLRLFSKNIFIFLLLLTQFLNAQEKNDTNAVKDLLSKTFEYRDKPDSSLLFVNKAIALGLKVSWLKGIALGYYMQGEAYFNMYELQKAIEADFKCLEYWDKFLSTDKNIKYVNKVKLQKSYAYGNLGVVYENLGNYIKSQEYHFKALKISEELNEPASIARNSGNIASLYRTQKDFEKAKKYFLRAISIDAKLNNQSGLARHYLNMGNMYADMGQSNKAISSYNQSLKISESLKDNYSVGQCLGNIGTVYSDIADSCIAAGNTKKAVEEIFPRSLENYNKALKISTEMNDMTTCAGWNIEIGATFTKLKKYDKAISYLEKALLIATTNGFNDLIDDCYKNLSDIYVQTKHFDKAYAALLKYYSVRDSVFNSANTKKIVETQMQYDFDKKEGLAKAEQDKKDALAEEEKRTQKIITFSVSLGLILTGFLALIIFRNLRLNKRKNKIILEQKLEVEKQKEIVEEKQKEIVDSIHYAKRIQNSLMPTEKYIDKNLKQFKNK